MAEFDGDQIAKMFQSWGESLHEAFTAAGLSKVSFHTAAPEPGLPHPPVNSPDEVHEFKQAMPFGTFCGVCGRSRDDTGGYHTPTEVPVTIDGLNAEIRQLRAELEAAKVDKPWWHQMRDDFVTQVSRLSGKPVNVGISPQEVLRALRQVEGLEQLRGQVAGYRHSLQDRDTRIAQLRSNLQARDARVTALEMDLRRKDEENAELRSTYAEEDVAFNELRDLIPQEHLDTAGGLVVGAVRAWVEAIVVRKNGEIANQQVALDNLRRSIGREVSDGSLDVAIARLMAVFAPSGGLSRASRVYQQMRAKYTVEHDAGHGTSVLNDAIRALLGTEPAHWRFGRESFDRIVEADEHYLHIAALAMAAYDVTRYDPKQRGGE